MASEVLEEIKIVGEGLPELPKVQASARYQADHDPAPRIDLVDLPSGEGAVALVKTGEDEWKVERFAGPTESVCRHTFRSLSTFVAWLRGCGADPSRAQVFADLRGPLSRSNGSKWPHVVAKLEPGDPDGDRVVCEVAYSPAIRAWAIETAGKRLSQKELFSLVRGYGKALYGAHSADGLLGTLAALRVIGTSTLECELAANGRTLISGARGELRVTQELPGVVELDLPIYQGVEISGGIEAHYRLEGLLDVETTPQGLSVGISFPALDETLALADADLIAHVQGELGEPWLVCLGSESAATVQKREGFARLARTASGK